jgi:hypothetical protein
LTVYRLERQIRALDAKLPDANAARMLLKISQWFRDLTDWNNAAIDGRPVLAYSSLNRGCSSLNATSVKGSQGMILGYSLLGAYVAEHIQLLLIFSAHAFFLSD